MNAKLIYDRIQAGKVRSMPVIVETVAAVAGEASRLGFSEPLIVACYDTELFSHWW